MQMSFRPFNRPMIRNIKESLLPKSGMQKSNFLKDPGYVKGACCMECYKVTSMKYPMLKVLKEIKASTID